MNEIASDQLISVDQAIAILDGLAVSQGTITIPLGQADGLVLAEALRADRDMPAFDKSVVDGYALRSADLAQSTTLRDSGEIAAGSPAGAELAAGACIAIMTGAPVPPGADAICPVESTQSDGGSVTIMQRIERGQFIELRGTHWQRGDQLLPANTLLTPAALAVAASIGAATVSVYTKPRVGVLTTGDEVVAFDEAPGPSQLRDSNSILIASLLKRLDCEPVSLGHAADDPAVIAERLQIAGLDAICITGGMSMGRHDYVPAVVRQLGYQFAITKLRMRPGKPFVVATKPQSPVIFGLPGNPVSGFVCVVRLASRMLLRMQGRSPEPGIHTATLVAELPANGPREFYQPAIVTRDTVQPLNWRGSADVLTLARVNALIRRPAGAPAEAVGNRVEYFRLP